MTVKTLVATRNANSFWATKTTTAESLSHLTSRRRHRSPKLPCSPARTQALWLHRRQERPRYGLLFRKMARMQNERLPVMTFQKLLMKEDLGDYKTLSQIVSQADSANWADRLKNLAKRGWTEDDLNHWVWILSADGIDACVARLVSSDRRKPPFVLLTILQDPRPYRSPKTLDFLVDYVNKIYTKTSGIVRQLIKVQTTQPQTGLRHSLFLLILRRLVRQVQKSSPRSIVSLAQLTQSYILHLSSDNRLTYRRRCEVFNLALLLFSKPASFRPLQHMEFNWRAQRVLLSMSDSMKKPLVIDNISYRAIRKVLLAQKKSANERKVATRYAKSWPPYRQDFDGHDAKRTPEEDQSRSVKAGTLMTESGYERDDYDAALDALGGGSPNQPPTIQTRTLAPAERAEGTASDSLSVIWAMKIRSTRNAQEAWRIFNSFTDEAPTLGVYTEMILKLLARDADSSKDVLPGDLREVFPIHHGNYSEYELARLTPPTVKELYQQMLSEHIKPRGTLLQQLVANAASPQEGLQYLRDSDFPPGTVAHLTLSKGHLHTVLRQFPLSIFSSYIQLLCNLHPNRRGRQEIHSRELQLIQQAIKLTKARLPPGTAETATFRPVWQTICRALARPHIALVHGDRMFSDMKSLEIFLDVNESIEKGTGVDAEIFIYLCRTIQKVASSQLEYYDGDSYAARVRSPVGIDRLNERLRDAKKTLMLMFSKMTSPLSSIDPDSGLPQILHPIGPPQLHAYMRTLALVEDTENMIVLLQWILKNKAYVDDEAERKANGRTMIAKMLCAFEAFAAPRLDSKVREELDEMMRHITEMDPSWRWPTPEETEAYVQADRRGVSQRLQQKILSSWWGQEPDIAALQHHDAEKPQRSREGEVG